MDCETRRRVFVGPTVRIFEGMAEKERRKT
jgi:hypothetical protein